MEARCQGRRSVSDKAVTLVAQHRRRKLGPGLEALSDLPFCWCDSVDLASPTSGPPFTENSQQKVLTFHWEMFKNIKTTSDTMAPWGSLLLRVASNLGGRERKAVLKHRRILLQSFCRENSVSRGRCEVTVTVSLTAQKRRKTVPSLLQRTQAVMRPSRS